MVLDAFRHARGAALTSRQIAEQLVKRKGLEMVAADLVPQLQKTVIVIANRLLAAGTLEEGEKDGLSRTWRLA